MTHKSRDALFTSCFAIALLGLVNFLVFRGHYFGSDCFPWDFWKSYYAVVAFWTTALRQHLLPEWIPFSSMGYPFFLNLQSSFFYPPLWIFVLPGIHYSLHAAVIVQCLHVFWGACGVFLLVKLLTGDWRSALFGALAYHFFGGFYSNSEHLDIVRAYAWLPWLFWGTTVKDRLQSRNLLLPAITYCAVTASYPGNIGSHTFFVGLYLAYQYYRAADTVNRTKTLLVGGLFGLGIMLSVVALGPGFFLRKYLIHSHQAISGPWPFANWVSLVAPWASGHASLRGYVGDPSLISAFVGIPTIVLLLLIQKPVSRAFAVWWGFLIVGLTFAAGRTSFFYDALITVVPVLGLSRFPSSDYRGVLALSIIVLAAASLSDLLSEPGHLSANLIRTRLKYLCLVPLVVMGGIFGVSLPEGELIWLLIIWGMTIVALYMPSHAFLARPWLSPVILSALIIVGGFHVINVSRWTWTAGGANLDDMYKRRIGFPTYEFPLPVTNSINGLPTRPARIDRKRNDFTWSGYLDGTYQMSDWGNMEMTARNKVASKAALWKYMMQPLRPLVFPNAQHVSCDTVIQRLGQLDRGASPQENAIVPLTYGLNTTVYGVNLPTDSLMVENEIWFPGWKGKVVRENRTTSEIPVASVDKSLRAWHLPAGRYTFVTRFQTPHFRVALIVSLAGLIIYLSLLAVIAFRRHQTRIMNKQGLDLPA
jgi:hypothetical protein